MFNIPMRGGGNVLGLKFIPENVMFGRILL